MAKMSGGIRTALVPEVGVLKSDNRHKLPVPNCGGAPDNWIWLIIGAKKAMLIDTCYGLGDMKGLVDEITGGMPLIVANTHGHFDHAGGD
jgi:glyoxylase-like metal-dependent hydrolase (beta-lactamase superfamily II)